MSAQKKVIEVPKLTEGHDQSGEIEPRTKLEEESKVSQVPQLSQVIPPFKLSRAKD